LRRLKDWKLHFADSLDFDDGEGLRLSERLPDTRSDEAAQQAENDDALANTYSEAYAYVIALSNFRSEHALLASHLAILIPTLRSRMRKLNEQAGRQPSLFDGKQRIDEAFLPLPGRVTRPLSKESGMTFEHHVVSDSNCAICATQIWRSLKNCAKIAPTS